VSRQEGLCDPTRRFTGKELDPETGLYYYGGRYYDPEISRFVSPDPFVAEVYDPQNLNRYSYVLNDPVNYIDPSGYFHRHKKSGGFFGSIFGSIFGGIFGFFFGGPVGAAIGASSGFAMGQLPADVLHGMEIFGGIAMLMSGNPAGLFFVAQGALGFCKDTGCQISSAMMGLAGAAIGFSDSVHGTAGGGNAGFGLGAGMPGGDVPGGGLPSLGGLAGFSAAAAAVTLQGTSIYYPPSGLNPYGQYRDVGTGEIIPRVAYIDYLYRRYGPSAVINEMIKRYGQYGGIREQQ
jgi:RHS repeat-associated protein